MASFAKSFDELLAALDAKADDLRSDVTGELDERRG